MKSRHLWGRLHPPGTDL